MVHEASGIQKLEDLKELELAISDSRPFALWMKKKLPLTNVTMVPYSGSVGEFLTKPAFAQQAYVFSEPFVAREQGSDPRVLMVSDIGFNPYASVLVTTEKVISDQPDLVRRMVTSSVLGWTQYLADPDSTNAHIHSQNTDMSLEVLRFGAEQMRPLCEPESGVLIGGMTAERWQTLVAQIVEIGEAATGAVAADDCFTTRFLNDTKSTGD
jgi:NitT/TauT family transport system substrate-binding protein